MFGADRTYFVLNGTSTSNKVVTGAVLKRGDLVLFDRNNHKSLHQGALVQAGAIADLPTDRAQSVRHDRRGRLGRVGREIRCASRSATTRSSPTSPAPTRRRPFRLACIQLATYDGTVYNVKKVLERIGHLCDYVLWDEAWIGYNAFHPLFDDHSPMRLKDLSPEIAGAFLDAVGAQAARRLLAGFADPQARRAHPRTAPLRRAQALQRSRS